MLDKKQILEIREHLEKAQNPVFFFDNDCDGLMSFVILRRFIGRGKGIPIKSFPELDAGYTKRIEEFNSDYIFILDKPMISKGFIEEMKKKNVPIVWIDHHFIEENKEFCGNNGLVSYFNPVFSKEMSSEPVSFISYEIAGSKDNMWLAMVGCIADNFIPPFEKEFALKYPELWKKNSKGAFEILYESEFGKIVSILDFSLKDRISNVVAMINFMIKANSPADILNENEKNFKIIQRYKHINSAYTKLIEKARKIARNSKKIIFFQYGGELSLSANVANELSYRFPGKIVMVAYIKGASANVSIRGNSDVRKITLDAIKTIEHATGGGHEHATGARISVDDLPKFKEFFERSF